jgi:hypothetical protein
VVRLVLKEEVAGNAFRRIVVFHASRDLTLDFASENAVIQEIILVYQRPVYVNVIYPAFYTRLYSIIIVSKLSLKGKLRINFYAL